MLTKVEKCRREVLKAEKMGQTSIVVIVFYSINIYNEINQVSLVTQSCVIHTCIIHIILSSTTLMRAGIWR